MEVVHAGDLTALRTDHYELTMVASALESASPIGGAVFEAFTRGLPDGRAYGVVAGTNRIVESITRFEFTNEVVDHLVVGGSSKTSDDRVAPVLPLQR